MTTPFTNPYTPPSGVTWDDLLSEILISWSEHQECLGEDPYVAKWVSTREFSSGDTSIYSGEMYTSLSDGNVGNVPSSTSSHWRVADVIDLQDANYWATFQTWIDGRASSFIDDVNGPLKELEEGQTDYSRRFLFFTTETFREKAGLNPDGFRRATQWDGSSDPVYSYGNVQAGDILGPWIFEDLQKALTALTWLPLFGYVDHVRGLFPEVTGRASFYGDGKVEPGDPVPFGVWYTYCDSASVPDPETQVRLGGSGTYPVILDARGAGGGNDGNVSLGAFLGGLGLLTLDAGNYHPLSTLESFSASLAFLDPTDLVENFGCFYWAGNPLSHTESFDASSAAVTANLAGYANAGFTIFPVVKVPFTYTVA